MSLTARVARCAAIVTIFALLGLVAHPGGVAAASDQAISFERCGDGFRCGTLTVPLVDGQPAGSTIPLAVVQHPATDRDRRIGTLVVNPGGPGAPAVEFLRASVRVFPREIRERFDLVAFDPRGTGDSAPVDCVDGLDPLFDLSFSPTDDRGRQALLDAFAAIGAACARRIPEMLTAVSTATAAQDLDRLRAALGERRISYLGYSYGSYLGALYARRFPHRLRAIVLDGPVDPRADAIQLSATQARGFELALDEFLRECSRKDGCAFHSGGRATDAYDALRRGIAVQPLVVGDRRLNDTRFDAAVLDRLYLGRAGWPSLARALDAAERGEGRRMLELADSFAGRESGGGDNNLLEAFWTIGCLDGPEVAGATMMRRVEAASVGAAPRLGAFIANNGAACAVWPVPPAAPAVEERPPPQGPPALVVAARHDPATPFRWADALVQYLGQGIVLSAPGWQHTSYLSSGSACVDDRVTDYLLTRRLPAARVRC